MSEQLVQRLCHELTQLVLIDPHTHINAHQPASQTLADILGYHYYTELAHSAGFDACWSKPLPVRPFLASLDALALGQPLPATRGQPQQGVRV